MDHLSLLTVAALLDAGFTRVQARKLESIGLHTLDAQRQRHAAAAASGAAQGGGSNHAAFSRAVDRFEPDAAMVALLSPQSGSSGSVKYRTQAEVAAYQQGHARALTHANLSAAAAEYSARADKLTIPEAPNLSDGLGSHLNEKRKLKAIADFKALDKDGNGNTLNAAANPSLTFLPCWIRGKRLPPAKETALTCLVPGV